MAQELLQTAAFFKDEVYERMCNSREPCTVLGINFFYHRNCKIKCLYKNSQCKKYAKAWDEIVEELEEGIHGIKGYTLDTNRDKLNRIDKSCAFRIWDVEMLLIGQFGDSIDFLRPSGKIDHRWFTVSTKNVLADHVRSENPESDDSQR